MNGQGSGSSYFSTFIDTCESIRATTSKNKKVDLILDYISQLDEDALHIAVLFLSGKVFPRGSFYNLNIGFRTILQSLQEISSLNNADIMRIHLKQGDMGSIAEYAVSKKQIVTLFNRSDSRLEQLTLQDVYIQLKKIANLSGPRSNNDKKNLLKGLLARCTPLEAKYLVKIISNEMRMGSYEGLVELAIAKAFGKDIGNVREAMLISGDIANVALLSKKNLLDTVTIKPFVPMSFMLADVMFTSKEIMKYFEKPLLCEFKYDGIRVQMHKFGNECKLFSRNLADVSYAFPELVESALQTRVRKENENVQVVEKKGNIPMGQNYDDTKIGCSDDFILDGELLAVRNDQPLPFQDLQKRLRRKNMTKGILDEIPVCYIVYDIMFCQSKQVIKETLENRKKLLSGFSFNDSKIINATSNMVTSEIEIENYFKKSKDSGHEGLVIKDPASGYHPGKRGRYWIKLKEELDTIDTVIVAAEYGHGKRAGTLSDYTLAVRDTNPVFEGESFRNENGETIFSDLKIIGKAYSGLSNDEITYMTGKLRSIVVKDEGSRITVKPEIVLEVSFDTIQKSNRHDSGYALRFPRIKNIRYDKKLEDIDELEKIKVIYENQFHIKNKIDQKKEL
ncbi:MAG: ATP-dependent DNA ligase [Thermoproteota archaeon]|nr:ATP-dependent DNA ligase [Thermoproteota archaeon]